MLALVGESGSGKTTVASAVLGLLSVGTVRGSIRVAGEEIVGADRLAMRRVRRDTTAAILQDPTGSLNPVRSVRSQLAESARVAGIAARGARRTAVQDALARVGLNAGAVLGKLPHELSGGMSQRVAIAMALVKSPKLIVADEPTSALDLRSQATIVRLLLRLQRDEGMAVLLITHDINLALHASDRIAVMYGGRLVETCTGRSVDHSAHHPYTEALLAATPRAGESSWRSDPLAGQYDQKEVGSDGCPFRTRCDRAEPRCGVSFPEPIGMPDRKIWCWEVADRVAAATGGGERT
jgi:oligopeptide/dipeptide ABC transporter ATP-binding protein